MIERGDWQVSDVARNAYDLEGKVVGTIGAGRIGFRVLQRLVPFNCKELLYYDYAPLPEHAAKEVNARRVEDLKDFVSQVCSLRTRCDFVLLKLSSSAMLSPSTAPCTRAPAASSTPTCSSTSRRVLGSSTLPVAPSATRMPSPRL